MKTILAAWSALAALVSVFLLTLVAACVSPTSPGAVTSSQQLVANGVEDAISIGLVPVLTKNASYLDAARGVASALGAFSGSTLTPDDVNAFLAKTPLAAADARAVAGIVNAAWSTYSLRYSQQVGASVRPDAKLFLGAVANGINRAIAAVPR